jgi:hypothetical protein
MPNFVWFLQIASRIIRHSQDFVCRVVGTRGYAWAHPIFVEAGAEIQERARLFATDWMDRYVSLSFFVLPSLTFARANTRLRAVIDEFFVAFSHADVPRMKQTAARAALLFGEIILLRLAVRFLVSPLFFSWHY